MLVPILFWSLISKQTLTESLQNTRMTYNQDLDEVLLIQENEDQSSLYILQNERTILPKLEDYRSKFEPLAIGSVSIKKNTLDGMVALPKGSFPTVIARLASAKPTYVMLHGPNW